MTAESKTSFIPTVFGLIALFALAMGFIALPLQQLTHTTEPLADRETLAQLSRGESLPQPIEESQAIFHGTASTPMPLTSLMQASAVLGVTTTAKQAAEKRIEVDLAHQKVYAYDGNTKTHEFTVSTGKWGRTPTGEFRIWTKVKSQLMKGGNPKDNTYYYLPNVPWVMFFYNDQIAKMRGFSFHGTYWHNNFGQPMSHGCINMKSEEAKILYDWATPVVTNAKAWSTPATDKNPGTRVIIYGEAPTI